MLKKLLPYLKPYRWRVVWALSQVFLIAGFELLKPWPLQVVIDNVLGGKPFPIAALSSSPPSLILLGACLAIVVVHFGGGALAALSTPISSGCRSPFTGARGSAIFFIGLLRIVSPSRR